VFEVAHFGVEPSGDLTTTLPETCSLAAGHWWVAQQVRIDIWAYGQHFWNTRSARSHHEGHWRNPQDGFSTGCTVWTPQTRCGSSGPDLLFRIEGREETAEPVPAIGPIGMTLCVLAVSGGLAWILRRSSSGQR
jgi:hypothetical protein